jgi:hypothetical protein
MPALSDLSLGKLGWSVLGGNDDAASETKLGQTCAGNTDPDTKMADFTANKVWGTQMPAQQFIVIGEDGVTLPANTVDGSKPPARIYFEFAEDSISPTDSDWGSKFKSRIGSKSTNFQWTNPTHTIESFLSPGLAPSPGIQLTANGVIATSTPVNNTMYLKFISPYNENTENWDTTYWETFSVFIP